METVAAAVNDKRPWILVVDDSRVVRKTVLKILEADFNVIEAEDGQAGWRLLRQDSRIDVVISDIQMPEMDGYSLICKVRAVDDPDLREIPIIVITSADDEITRERAYACGASDFVLKPFNAPQLLGCLQNQLGVSQSTADAMTTAEQKTVQTQAPRVENIVVAANAEDTIDDALKHFDDAIDVMRKLKTATIAPHALTLVLRLLPLLKYCNAAFKLGMDKEIAVFHQRVAAVRAKHEADVSGKKPQAANNPSLH